MKIKMLPILLLLIVSCQKNKVSIENNAPSLTTTTSSATTSCANKVGEVAQVYRRKACLQQRASLRPVRPTLSRFKFRNTRFTDYNIHTRGFSKDYPSLPEWSDRPMEAYGDQGVVKRGRVYRKEEKGMQVQHKGNVFELAFWTASEPGIIDLTPDGRSKNGWKFHDELYDLTRQGGKTEEAKIIGYLPTWRINEGAGFNYANSELYQYITHGIVAFLTFDEENLGEFSRDVEDNDDFNAIVSTVVHTGHQHDVKVLIALGGANDYGFLKLMKEIGEKPASQLLVQTVNKVKNFVYDNNLDGVDLDLECWWFEDREGGRSSNNPHPAGRGLTTFAKYLKQAIPDKIVSAALFGTSWYGNNYDRELADYVDWIGLMTYDFTGSWNDSPVGPHTALYKIRDQADYAAEQQGEWPGGASSTSPMEDNPISSVEDALWYWTNPFYINWQGGGQKLPRSKVAVGVPVYGYDFTAAKEPDAQSQPGQPVPPGYKVMRYNQDILHQFPDAYKAQDAHIKVPGSTPRPHFIQERGITGNYPCANNIYFETPAKAVEKLNFIKELGGQGVIIWELSNDLWEKEKSITRALYENSGNPVKENTIALPLTEATEGELPSVALNDNNVALQLYDDRDTTIPSFTEPGEPSVKRIRFGKINKNSNTVEWKKSEIFGSLASTRFPTHSVDISKRDMIVVYAPKIGLPAERDDRLLYRYKQYGSLNIDSVDPVIPDQDNPPYDYGNNPAVSINNKGDAVEVHMSEDLIDYRLWYRVGKTKDHHSIDWNGYHASYDYGVGPSVAINDDGIVVEVHQSQLPNDYSLWYHVGRIKGNEIEWGWGTKYEDKGGRSPLVAVNNNRIVIAAYEKDNRLYYRTGTINLEDLKIEWFQNSSTRMLHGKQFSISCNNEFALVSHIPDSNLIVGPIKDQVIPLADLDIPEWTEVQDEKGYSYCMIDSDATDNKEISIYKKIPIKLGTPYAYAVLTDSENYTTNNFPKGASIAIRGPNGTDYNTFDHTDEEDLFVKKEEDSIHSFCVQDPYPGDWSVNLKLPKDTEFHFEFVTLPSREVHNSIKSAFNENPEAQARLDEKWKVAGTGAAIGGASEWYSGALKGFIDLFHIGVESEEVGEAIELVELTSEAASVAAVPVAEFAAEAVLSIPPLAVAGLAAVIIGGTAYGLYEAYKYFIHGTNPATLPHPKNHAGSLAADIWSITSTQNLDNNLATILGGDYDTYINLEGEVMRRVTARRTTSPRVEEHFLRVATWNIGGRFGLDGSRYLNPISKIVKMCLFAFYGLLVDIDLIVFQEVSPGLRDSDSVCATIAAIGGYDYKYFDREYPNNGRTPTQSQQNDGYLILYPSHSGNVNDPEFLQEDEFVDPLTGGLQCRPPILLANLPININKLLLHGYPNSRRTLSGTLFLFTWHNEQEPVGLPNYTTWKFHDLLQRSRVQNRWRVIGGDFNTRSIREISNVATSDRIVRAAQIQAFRNNQDPSDIDDEEFDNINIFINFEKISGSRNSLDHILSNKGRIFNISSLSQNNNTIPNVRFQTGYPDHEALIADIIFDDEDVDQV